MNSLRAVLMTAITALSVVGTAAAHAEPRVAGETGDTGDHRAWTVKYDDLDINTDSGAKALYSRLRTAARRVCTSFEGKELRQKEQWKSCFNDSLARAVVNVNQERLTALHRSRAERAS